MLIQYKGCLICLRSFTVYCNYETIGEYKTLAAAKVAATREHKARIEYYASYNSGGDYAD